MVSEFHSSGSFVWRRNKLCLSGVELAGVAKKYGTPLYGYSLDDVLLQVAAYQQAFSTTSHHICYAVKANSTLAMLRALVRAGCSFDIVSGGELQRVLTVGADSETVIYSGVGKTTPEIDMALHQGIACFNVESYPELQKINQRARALKIRARVALRLNPNVDAKSHKYITTGKEENKFGIGQKDAHDIVAMFAQKNKGKKNNEVAYCDLLGVGCHIGSQIVTLAPYREMFSFLADFADHCLASGINLTFMDIGGGVGIKYKNERTLTPKALATALHQVRRKRNCDGLTVLVEPGRSIVGHAGVLLTSVLYCKNNFAIVDAGMNDLMRPALYQAYHQAVPLVKPKKGSRKSTWDIVGPVCETGDFLSLKQQLALQQDDQLAILNAGAYGMSMSSNYNSRYRPAEVMIYKGKTTLIREREQISDLLAKEHWQKF